VERLDQHAALCRPVGIETGDQFLEGRGGHRRGGFGGRASIPADLAATGPPGTGALLNDPLATCSPLSAGRLPAGRLALEPVVAALLADGLLAAKDAEHARASARHVRGLDAVHPLVLLANLKLPLAGQAGRELGLETLTEWLAR